MTLCLYISKKKEASPTMLHTVSLLYSKTYTGKEQNIWLCSILRTVLWSFIERSWFSAQVGDSWMTALVDYFSLVTGFS